MEGAGTVDRRARSKLEMDANVWFRRALVSGSVASIASTLALAACGRRELGDAATPLNGPSQWVLGTHAPWRDGFSRKHTVLGYGIHHFASLLWGGLFEALRLRRTKRFDPDLAAAASTTAVASVVDLALTPRRFRPGFERRLSGPALAAVYVAFGIGLFLAAKAGGSRLLR